MPRVRGAWAFLVLLAVLAGCAQGGGGPPPGIVAPPPDGTACYGRRQAFYAASDNAIAAEGRRQRLQGMSDFASSPAAAAITDLLGSRVPGGSAIASNLGTMLSTLSRNANEDTSLIEAFAGSFDMLTRCRRDEVNAIRRDVRARQLTRPEAVERLAAIRELATADAAVARDVNARLVSRTRQFEVAIEQVDTSIPRDSIARDPAVRRQRTETDSVRRVVQTNQRALITQAAAVEASVSQRSFDISWLRPAAATGLA